MDNKQTREYVRRMTANSARDMMTWMDRLWEEGKAKGWPKEVMNYLMWWEHEATRIPDRLKQLDPLIRDLRLEPDE